MSQGMLAKSWTQNSCHPLKVSETHPPNFIFPLKRDKKTRISQKDRGYTHHLLSYFSATSYLIQKKHGIFFGRNFRHPPVCFFSLSLVVGLLQEQVAPRGRFPSTTDDKQESLQKTGAHLGWLKPAKPTDFQCFFPLKSWLVSLGILLLAYERTPTALTG